MSEPTSKSAVDLVQWLQNTVDKAVADARNPHRNREHDVIWKGTSITLPAQPEKMTFRRAAEVMLEMEAAATQEFEFQEHIPGMPFDAAAAFAHVLFEKYGYVSATSGSHATFFGSMESPPRMQLVKTGPNSDDFIEVPIGDFKLPDINTTITTGFARPGPDAKSQFMDFVVSGVVTFEDKEIVTDLIAKAKERMRKHSIYRGKAMRLRVNSSQKLEALLQPEFLDVSTVDTGVLVLNEEVDALLKMTLNAVIQNTDACRHLNIPRKRGILFHGDYGTGKSLAALVTARLALDNNWTYVVVDHAGALGATLEFAKQFQPCVVFAEDIDRVVDVTRDDKTNDLINIIDGVLSKNDEIITVLTTNFIERIPTAMLRHGRLDGLIHFEVPDADSAMRLVHQYAGETLAATENMDGVAELIAGLKPATIREVVERAKLGMLISRGHSISRQDLIGAAKGIKAHADLLAPPAEAESEAVRFEKAFKGLFTNRPNGAILAEVQAEIETIKKAVERINSRV